MSETPPLVLSVLCVGAALTGEAVPAASVVLTTLHACPHPPSSDGAETLARPPPR